MNNYFNRHVGRMKQFVFQLMIVMLPFSVMACEKQDDLLVEEEQQSQQEMEDMTDEQQAIVKFLDRWSRAMVEQDIETLSGLMADDLVLVHITGATQSKQEWLNEVKAGTMRYYSIKRENQSIQVNGDAAVAKYISIIDANIWGSRNTWRLNVTMHLAKRNGNWIRVNP